MFARKLKSRSIASQIGGLNKMALVFLGLVGLIAVASTIYLGLVFDKVTDSTRKEAALGALGEDIAGARSAAMAYRLTFEPRHMDRMRSAIASIKERQPAITDMVATDPETFAPIDGLFEDVGAYENQFSAAVGFQFERSSLLGSMQSLGDRTVADLEALLQAENNAGNVAGAAIVGEVMRDILLARAYVERYLQLGAAQPFEMATASADQALTTLGQLGNRVWGDEQVATAVGISEAFVSYWNSALRLREIEDTRRAAFSELDVIGPRMQGKVTTVANTLQSDVTVRKAAGLLMVQLAAVFVTLTVVGASLLSWFVARRTSRAIVAGLDDAIVSMSQLAEGRTDIDLDAGAADPTTELGRMSQALAVFRENAIAREKLEATEKERASEAEATERARLEAEARAREEAAEAAEAERLAMLERLRASVGTVVEAAAAGDFTQRVEASFDEPSLRQLAHAVNGLVEKTDLSLQAATSVLSRVANGDLTQHMDGDFEGTFGVLQSSLNQTITDLSDLLRDVTAGCDTVAHQARAMSGGAQDLATRAQEQAASLEETSAAMTQMAASASSTADGAASANALAQGARDRVSEASADMAETLKSMEDVKSASNEILSSVTVIDNIAFQTTLLALNASVEAARAGPAGKGFAVVASEVRALAQRASDASREIAELIDRSIGEVARGVSLVERTGQSLEKAVGGVHEISDTMVSLNSASQEQATGVREATNALSHLDTITQSNAHMAEETRENAEYLSSSSDEMRELVNRFTLSDNGQAQTAVTADQADPSGDAQATEVFRSDAA